MSLERDAHLSGQYKFLGKQHWSQLPCAQAASRAQEQPRKQVNSCFSSSSKLPITKQKQNLNYVSTEITFPQNFHRNYISFSHTQSQSPDKDLGLHLYRIVKRFRLGRTLETCWTSLLFEAGYVITQGLFNLQNKNNLCSAHMY